MKRRPQHKARVHFALAYVAVATSTLIACATVQPPPNLQTVDNLAAQVAEVARAVGCSRVQPIWDDMYNYAEMRGAVCYLPNDNVLNIRAYNTVADRDAGLVDWPISATTISIMVSGTVFIAGRHDQLVQVRSQLPEFSEPLSSLTLMEPSDATLRLTECVQFVTSGIKTFVLEPETFKTQSGNLNAIFPGLTELVEGLISEDEASALRLIMLRDDIEFESDLSTWGGYVKGYCERLYER